MSELRVVRIGHAAGAEVTGVDLSAPLDEATFREVRQAWLDHHVLCFPNQNMSKQQLLAFADRFEGDLDDFRHEKTFDPDDPRILFLSSKPEPGKKWDGYKQGVHWHSDRSYTERPATATFVLSKEIPQVGGDTMFANQYMAYETLSPKFQEIVAGLSAVHSQSNLKLTSLKVSPEVAAGYRGVDRSAIHPVVKVHPATGKAALYVGDRVRQFVGMTVEESRPIIDHLNRHAVQYEFTYRHRWHVQDLVMWDNRCLMHYAPLDYDPQTEPRFMWRCSLVGPKTGIVIDANTDVDDALRPAG
jgi:taurine dioxygenase